MFSLVAGGAPKSAMLYYLTLFKMTHKAFDLKLRPNESFLHKGRGRVENFPKVPVLSFFKLALLFFSHSPFDQIQAMPGFRCNRP